MTAPWPAGAATGVGSLPGTDIAEAQRLVLGELPDLPHLPELPARGPGADMIGRGAGLLVELPVELYAARWRLTARPGRDLRRTRDLLERDLDQLTVQADGYAGALKLQAAGPWTLAASVDLPLGGRVLRDRGAARDLAASLAEGLRAHVAEVTARVPHARVVLQLDEPSLPAVLAGRVPTESGLGTLRAVPRPEAAAALGEVVAAVGVPVVIHCCAPDVPLDVVRTAGAAGVALDLSLLDGGPALDALGEAIDDGLALVAGAVPAVAGAAPAVGGAVPAVGGAAPTSREVAGRVRDLWRKLGFPLSRLPGQVAVAPACGLAGATPAYARGVLAACRDAGRRLVEEGDT